MTKLTEEEVCEIRFLADYGFETQVALARMFGVSVGCIRDVVSRRTHKDVVDNEPVLLSSSWFRRQ